MPSATARSTANGRRRKSRWRSRVIACTRASTGRRKTSRSWRRSGNEKLAEKDWYQKIKRWRSWLGGRADQEAKDNIASVTDPAAVKALATGLKDDKEPPATRLLYVEALGKIEAPAAPAALAVYAIDDPVEEVRLTCLDKLEKTKNAQVVVYFVSKLDPKKSDNAKVNRAAVALARMKDPSAIGPLINALITTHKFKAIPANPGNMSMSFNPNPKGGSVPGGISGTGMGMNMNQPKLFAQQMQNQSVLDALVALTGQNFGFDPRAWHAWYNAQKKSEAGNARRD